MVRDRDINESAFIDKASLEYRSQGYDVLREVPLEFAPGFIADLVVQKEGHSTVVEVRTRNNLPLNPRITQLAEAIGSMPDWSFELQIIGEPERLDAPRSAEPFVIEDISDRIAQSQAALNAGLHEAAFVLAWSACEAGVRSLMAMIGVTDDRITESRYLLGQAAFQGVISDDDDDVLSTLLAQRNAIVHGFRTQGLDLQQAKDLIRAAKTIQRASTTPPATDESPVGNENILGPLNIVNRLNDIRSMMDLWPQGTDITPQAQDFDWLVKAFEEHYPEDYAFPYAFPTLDGDIEFEWRTPRGDLFLTVAPVGRAGECTFIDLSGATERPVPVELTGENGWEQVIRQMVASWEVPA